MFLKLINRGVLIRSGGLEKNRKINKREGTFIWQLRVASLSSGQEHSNKSQQGRAGVSNMRPAGHLRHTEHCFVAPT